MDKNRQSFLRLSAELTGYSELDLEGTGLVNLYQDLIENEISKEIAEFLYDTSNTVFNKKKAKEREDSIRIDLMASPTLWPICQGLIMLWYYGEWTSMSSVWYKYYAKITPDPNVKPGSTSVPSAAAYTEQLSYRSAGAHPPGAHPTGHGSWGLDPVFGDFTNSKTKVS